MPAEAAVAVPGGPGRAIPAFGEVTGLPGGQTYLPARVDGLGQVVSVWVRNDDYVDIESAGNPGPAKVGALEQAIEVRRVNCMPSALARSVLFGSKELNEPLCDSIAEFAEGPTENGPERADDDAEEDFDH